MAKKHLQNITMDSSGLKELRDRGDRRDGLTEVDWESGVVATLQILYTAFPCETSRIVLDMLQQTGKKTVIVPEMQPWTGQPANAHAQPDEPEKATFQDKPTKDPRVIGVGGGSDSHVYFTAQDCEPAGPSASLDAVDEALFHELVHALRQHKGLEDATAMHAHLAVLRAGDVSKSDAMQTDDVWRATHPGKTIDQRPPRANQYSQLYDDFDEFAAILVTNIYRSEKGRPGLRLDHRTTHSYLPPSLADDENFYLVWRGEVDRLCLEMAPLCDRLAAIKCPFNPIGVSYDVKGKRVPGRASKTGRILPLAQTLKWPPFKGWEDQPNVGP
jgi:hypothetical protein